MEGRRPAGHKSLTKAKERVYPKLVTRTKLRPLVGPLRIRESGALPHWDLEEGLYFVTFRLADSLPASLVRKYATIHEPDEPQRREIELALDQGYGKCYLREPQVAESVADALHFLDGRDLRLDAWCVMPNHVHLVFQLNEGRDLWRMMHSLKSYTAHRANRILRRRGPFWQPEYFDRLIRKGTFDRVVDYVVRNPEKAGLKKWPWVGIAPGL
jgi:REP element-mobilizing transposase RayT